MQKRFKFDDFEEPRCGEVLNQITHPFVCFSQERPNRYRQVTQVIDLLTFDLRLAQFTPQRLCLAVVVVSLLISYDFLILPENDNFAGHEH